MPVLDNVGEKASCVLDLRGATSLWCLVANDLAIDLGTANSLVYVPGRGVMVNEPSLVAVNRRWGRIETVGRQALEMLGRTPAEVVVIRPIKDGVIADFDLAEEMLKYFIRKARPRRALLAPRVVIGTPSELTQVERRAMAEAARAAGASDVYLIQQPVAAALGADLPVTKPGGNMVVDIGGGTTDIAVISLSGIVYSRTLRVAGNEMDEVIIDYVKRKHNLLIGERTAERIKVTIGSATPAEKMTMEIRGRDLIQGVPRTLRIAEDEIREALTDIVSTIVEGVRVALERTPPDLCADIVDRGILLTGGGALLRNLDQRMEEATGVPVRLAGEPLLAVILGIAKILQNPRLLQTVARPS